MFKRLVVIVMLMLFPFQWSAAQGHELKDDAGAFETVYRVGADISQLLAHTDEPGGICQFHELSQPAAAVLLHGTSDLLARSGEAWSLALQTRPPGLQAPDEIDKPKWGSGQLSAANS